MLNQKKVKIFLVKFRKSPAKQFLEIAYIQLQLRASLWLRQTTDYGYARLQDNESTNGEVAGSKFMAHC